MKKIGNAVIYNRLLKRARESAGLSQDDLANLIGTTASTISGWERREHHPSAYFREKLCSVLGKSAVELGFLSPEEPQVAPPIYDPFIPVPVVLIGRDEHLVYIRQQLQINRAAFTVLLGLPGVGKTALATMLTSDQKIRKHFRDGILWTGLGPEPNIPGLLSHWGKQLGLSTVEMADLNTRETWIAALRSAIGDRSLLLVIDDAWKLEDVLSCQVGGPNCAYLLTTRFPDIAASVTIDGVIRIEELKRTDGITLLQMLAPRVVERERERAVALVEAVGGLPLALTLMGNYLRKEAHSGQSRRIQAALQRLSNGAGRLLLSEPRVPGDSYRCLPQDKALSLQAIIAVADQHLTQEARQALYALAILPTKPDTFSEEVALTLTASTAETLDMLIDTGLLESNNEDRYTLHQIIADYAHMHLKDERPYERLIGYALHTVEHQRDDHGVLERDLSTFLAALEAAHTLQKQRALVRLVARFVPFLLTRGMYALAHRHVQRMLEAATTLQDSESIAHARLLQEELEQRHSPCGPHRNRL